MQSITVDKKTLIETITKNRDDHREQFLAAQDKYREKAVEILDERLQQAREGKRINLVVRLPEPVDYTESYNTALSMLEWEIEDQVELDQHDFERYVENKWEWQQMFAANTQSYLAQ
jgi:hypothetical protein